MLLALLGCVAITARSSLPITLTDVPPATTIHGDDISVAAVGDEVVLALPRPDVSPSGRSSVAAPGQESVSLLGLPGALLTLTEPDGCVRSLHLSPEVPLDRRLLLGAEVLVPPAFLVDVLVLGVSEDDKMARWTPRTVDARTLPCQGSQLETTTVHIEPVREGSSAHVFGVVGTSTSTSRSGPSVGASTGDRVTTRTYTLRPLGQAPLDLEIETGTTPWLVTSSQSRVKTMTGSRRIQLPAAGSPYTVQLRPTRPWLMKLSGLGAAAGGVAMASGFFAEDGPDPLLLQGGLALVGASAVGFGFSLPKVKEAAPE